MQILDQFFDISLSLPRPVASSNSTPIESSYAALSSLEDVIAILRRVSLYNVLFFLIRITHVYLVFDLLCMIRTHLLILQKYLTVSFHLFVYC